MRGIQSPHVVYDLPAGMPIACGHFDGLQDVLERFLTNFYLALDVRFIAKNSLQRATKSSRWVVSKEKTRKAAVPINVPFAHVWTVQNGYLQRLRAFTYTAVLTRALEKG